MVLARACLEEHLEEEREPLQTAAGPGPGTRQAAVFVCIFKNKGSTIY
jgi:hypothetical protein